MSIIIICLDVDGTLVDSKGQLFSGAENIRKLRRKNVIIGLCSARSISSLKKIATSIGGVDFLIGLQGAHCIALDGMDYHTKWMESLSSENIAEIKRFVESNSLEFWLYSLEGWHCKYATPAVMMERSIVKEIPIIGEVNPNSVQKASIVLPVSRRDDRVEFDVSTLKISGTNIFASHPYMLELVSSSVGVCKGVDRLRFEYDDNDVLIVALGDSRNDIGMLTNADLPFTFEGTSIENEIENVQKIPSPHNDGLNMFIREIEKLISRTFE
jgi:HAD superfamily hydrolase (TIGR01484 family)